MMASLDRPALSTRALVAGYERDLPIVRGVDFAVWAGVCDRSHCLSQLALIS